MKNELEELKKGATWQNVYDAFWYIALARYVTYQQLKRAFPPDEKSNIWCNKIITPKKIELAVEHGLIDNANGVLRLTRQGLEFLKTYSTLNTNIIKLAEGKGEKDKLHNADIVLELIKHKYFYAVFYPDFYKNPRDNQPFLIPDGALILKKDDTAKLIFLEIENKKPNWEEHLNGKKGKYEIIEKDYRTWDVWWRGCILSTGRSV